MKNSKIDILNESPLKWPEGWPRTLIKDRKARNQWKKSADYYRGAIADELHRLGATAARITSESIERQRQDPGVAVWFSLKKTEDSDWQIGLGLNDPAPTLDEIDAAFRAQVKKYHPDNGETPDLELFKKARQYRDQARAWVMGTALVDYEHCIPCDTFAETRLNLAGIRLALSYFRGLERIGIPAILDRVMSQAFKVGLLTSEKKG